MLMNEFRGIHVLPVCVFLMEVVRCGAGEYIGRDAHIKLLSIPTHRYTVNQISPLKYDIHLIFEFFYGNTRLEHWSST